MNLKRIAILAARKTAIETYKSIMKIANDKPEVITGPEVTGPARQVLDLFEPLQHEQKTSDPNKDGIIEKLNAQDRSWIDGLSGTARYAFTMWAVQALINIGMSFPTARALAKIALRKSSKDPQNKYDSLNANELETIYYIRMNAPKHTQEAWVLFSKHMEKQMREYEQRALQSKKDLSPHEFELIRNFNPYNK
jgi:hypothetical protein